MDPAIKKPKQNRSAQTMERMLNAAEMLLEEKSWRELTIQDVVSNANCSVGAFYGRFKDKEGLLHALDERFFDSLVAIIETAVSEPQWETMTLAETIKTLAQLVVDLHQQKQGVMRALILQARLESDPRFREREARLMTHVPTLLALILAHRHEIYHDDAETAVQFGFLQMFFTVREMMIWPHVAANMPYQEKALVSGVASAFLSYLSGAQLNDLES